MAKNRERTSGPNDVQIFELTMDNDENQDELNHQLRKPGEPECCASVKRGNAANDPPAATVAVQKCQNPD
jgi:hypothetical protein